MFTRILTAECEKTGAAIASVEVSVSRWADGKIEFSHRVLAVYGEYSAELSPEVISRLEEDLYHSAMGEEMEAIRAAEIAAAKLDNPF